MGKILTKESIDRSDYLEIKSLEKICKSYDNSSLKLELEYKLKVKDTSNVNDFFYYEDGILIGYLGISYFGGSDLELNGMVHPDHRRKGIFAKLFLLAIDSSIKRNKRILLLSDDKSHGGISFIENNKGLFYNKEHEMHLIKKPQDLPETISLLKALNKDAKEIYDQDKIYFSNLHDGDYNKEMTMPETEEKNGYTTYLAYQGDVVVGKVKLTIENNQGAIYGLGVKPDYRRQGLGRAILNHAIAILLKDKTNSIMLEVVSDNDKALDLYRDSGFEVVSTMAYYVFSQ